MCRWTAQGTPIDYVGQACRSAHGWTAGRKQGGRWWVTRGAEQALGQAPEGESEQGTLRVLVVRDARTVFKKGCDNRGGQNSSSGFGRERSRCVRGAWQELARAGRARCLKV